MKMFRINKMETKDIFISLNNVYIVLVDPSHLGNVGSAARAMKTMGLHNLIVVSSKNIITDESLALAKGARDVLMNAQILPTLDNALRDISFVAGTSARSRSIELPLYQPREAVDKMLPHLLADSKCAIIFGRERTGLTNEELQCCDIHINIDANPEYSSLNLAMSVQVLSYEFRQCILRQSSLNKKIEICDKKPSHEQLESYYSFLESNLTNCGFLKSSHNGKVMGQLRRIYAKSDLSDHELQILYGVTASLIKHS